MLRYHRLYHQYRSTKITRVFEEWNKYIPDIRPCYSVSPASSPEVVSMLCDKQIPMICRTAKDALLIKDASLVVIDGKRPGAGTGTGVQGGYREYIVRNIKSLQASPAAPMTPVWIYATISNESVEHARQMFEYIWANKCILNGIVFNISNFSHSAQSISPSMYSYKIAMDYILRNIVYPFEKEYGITTPAIMMDGRHHITQMRHLYELREYALSYIPRTNPLYSRCPELRLIIGSLIDDSYPRVINDKGYP
jgi:hypothetical protein